MTIHKEHLEQLLDPVINKLKKLILEYSQKYDQFNDIKFEINVDKKSESVIINLTVFNL